MPIEIRELIIKTEITSGVKRDSRAIKDKELNLLKKQLMEECKRLISENMQKRSYKR